VKMNIGADLPEGIELGHNELAAASASLMAHVLLPLFAERMSEDIARANVEGIVLELAYMFDDGEITVGDKSYRPRLAFIDEAGNVLPGVAELDRFHEYADAPLDIDPEAKITFEEVEFDEDEAA